MLVHIIMGRDIGENFIYIYEFESGGAKRKRVTKMIFRQQRFTTTNATNIVNSNTELYNSCSMNF